MADVTLTGETTELLQALIRNACVNDGTPDRVTRSATPTCCRRSSRASGSTSQRYEARPGRGSIVARIEGSDPDAPSLCLMGHTDVVPVNPDGLVARSVRRRADPLGRDEVWGRGAIDMLNLTSSMAVAFRHLARTGSDRRAT